MQASTRFDEITNLEQAGPIPFTSLEPWEQLAIAEYKALMAMTTVQPHDPPESMEQQWAWVDPDRHLAALEVQLKETLRPREL